MLAVLERRRGAHAAWSGEVEAKLTRDAQEALVEAGRQFAELADDKPYWQRLESLVLTVALPRYFTLARDEQQLEAQKYGLWRGGDLVSRIAYAAGGLVVSVIVLRTGLPKLLEPLPLAFFIGGPFIPDLQAWFAKRRYRSKLASLVDDMRDEAGAHEVYRPLMEDGSPVDDQRTESQSKTKVGE